MAGNPMSEPTPREALRAKIKNRAEDTFIQAYEDGVIDRQNRTEFRSDILMEDIELLINAEVLAVLNELEKKKETALYADFADGSVEDYTAIPLSAITQLKQRYGGKDSGDSADLTTRKKNLQVVDNSAYGGKEQK